MNKPLQLWKLRRFSALSSPARKISRISRLAYPQSKSRSTSVRMISGTSKRQLHTEMRLSRCTRTIYPLCLKCNFGSRRFFLFQSQEHHSKGLYHDMRNSAETPVTRSSELINEQVTVLQEEFRALWDRLRDLEVEVELKGWKGFLELSKAGLEHLTGSSMMANDQRRE